MPLTLFHGPPCPDKRRLLIEKIRALHAQHGDLSNTLVLVADKTQSTAWKACLPAELGISCLKSNPVFTFEELLLKLVKRNFHRAHVADENLCRLLIFLLIEKRAPQLFKNTEHPRIAINSLYDFFIKIKKCGLTPEKAGTFLQGRLDDDAILELFKDYQNELKKIFHYDAGDLYLALLDNTAASFTFPEEIQNIFITGIYPLHAGHRELLRRFKSAAPQIQFSVFYDEDFSRSDDLLATAYQDLGSLAETSYNVEAKDHPQKIPLQVFSTAFAEIEGVVRHIERLLHTGMPAQEVVIACPGSYASLLEIRLANSGIPFASRHSRQALDHFPADANVFQTIPSALLNSDRQAATPVWIKHALIEFRDDMEFSRSLLKNLTTGIDANKITSFIQSLESEITFDPAGDKGVVKIIGLSSLNSVIGKKVIFMGAHLESLQSGSNSAPYSPLLYSRREFAELLDFPIYRQKILFEKINQALTNGSAEFTLTRPLTDFSGKPATPLPFIHLDQSMHPAAPFTGIAKADTHPFPKFSELTSFSVTELETYLDCPYKYYAEKRLKIGDWIHDDIDPDAKSRGSFIHLVMEQWLKLHLDRHVAILKNPDSKNDHFKILDALIHEEAGRFADFQNIQPVVLESQLQKIFKALQSLIQTEIKLAGEGVKKSLPQHPEWIITEGGKKGFAPCGPEAGFRLTGRIDRIDIDKTSGVFTIIDYKSGEAPSKNTMKSGRDLQSVLYLHAVATALYPGFTPGAMLYYSVKTAKISGLSVQNDTDLKYKTSISEISTTEWESIRDKSLSLAQSAVHGIRNGNFAPRPESESICRVCNYAAICGYRKTDSEDNGDSDD